MTKISHSKNEKPFLQKLFAIIKPFCKSDKRWVAGSYLSLIIIAIVGSTYFNVRLIESQGNWMNQLIAKNSDGFITYLLFYLTYLLLYVPAIVLSSFLKGRLAIIWREWLTNWYLNHYTSNRNYYRIEQKKDIDNPDQRITEDVRTFTENVLNFSVDVITVFLQFVSFGVLLWLISPTLFIAAFVVSFSSTILSINIFGRKLSDLNFLQNKKEADFRFSMVRFRSNAESIAFCNGETGEKNEIGERLKQTILNSFGIVTTGAQYGLFFIGVNMLANVIPVAILADGFFKGIILIGTITKAQGAFGNVKNSFNIIIKSLKDLTQMTAQMNRLYKLNESFFPNESNETNYEKVTRTVDSTLSFKDVTLFTFEGERRLTKKMRFTLPQGETLLITGPSGCGKTSILRLIAGLWDRGTGDISTFEISQTIFIGQKPYLPLGSLRVQLLYPYVNRQITDEELNKILEQVKLAELPMRIGGYDFEFNFENVLSLGEQQRICFARLLLAQPKYAFLDEATSAVDVETEEQLFALLREKEITYITVGHREGLTKYHNKRLTMKNENEYVFSDC